MLGLYSSLGLCLTASLCPHSLRRWFVASDRRPFRLPRSPSWILVSLSLFTSASSAETYALHQYLVSYPHVLLLVALAGRQREAGGADPSLPCRGRPPQHGVPRNLAGGAAGVSSPLAWRIPFHQPVEQGPPGSAPLAGRGDRVRREHRACTCLATVETANGSQTAPAGCRRDTFEALLPGSVMIRHLLVDLVFGDRVWNVFRVPPRLRISCLAPTRPRYLMNFLPFQEPEQVCVCRPARR